MQRGEDRPARRLGAEELPSALIPAIQCSLLRVAPLWLPVSADLPHQWQSKLDAISDESCEQFVMKYPSSMVVLVLLLSVSLSAQANPVPTINGPVTPQAVVPGSNTFMLTVRGANFVPGAVVNWNGAARSTTYLSAAQVQAQIPASDVTAPGSALITVTNPAPAVAYRAQASEWWKSINLSPA